MREHTQMCEFFVFLMFCYCQLAFLHFAAADLLLEAWIMCLLLYICPVAYYSISSMVT